jgi:hypothetical protein
MTPALQRQIEACLAQLPADDGGGCPLDKALWMAETIVSEKLSCSVEIGVYKGRSFFPQAMAQRELGGLAIGIDPYSRESAREKDLSDQLRKVVDDLIDGWDVGQTYAQNLVHLLDWQLGNHALLLRETSEEAARFMPPNIGLLHIDGNHDVEYVTKDIELYLPHVQPGGLVVMDDTDWDSVRSCLHLLQGCTLESDHGSWQVWRKPGAPHEAAVPA